MTVLKKVITNSLLIKSTEIKKSTGSEFVEASNSENRKQKLQRL